MTSDGNLVLNAQLRDITGRKVEILREQGLIPAVLYGHNFENKNLSLNYKDFLNIYDKAGESTLIDIKIGDEENVKALIQDVQYHPVTDSVIHVDLRAVLMDEKIETRIPLKFTGVAPAVKELGGVLVTPLEEVHVKALPGSLISEIEVDISSLADFNSAIHIKDLNVPEGIEILVEEEVAVAIVEPPAQQGIDDTVSPEEAEQQAIKSQEDSTADKKEEEK